MGRIIQRLLYHFGEKCPYLLFHGYCAILMKNTHKTAQSTHKKKEESLCRQTPIYGRACLVSAC